MNTNTRPVIIAGAALLALAFASPAMARHGDSSTHAWHCQHQNLERTVAVVYESDGAVPCAVQYDKPTEGTGSSFPWRANNQVGYCEAKASGLVDKLRNWGWNCKAADDMGMKSGM